jgi:hypothetical protein
VLGADTSVVGDMFVGVTDFALVMPVLATSAVSDTANGNRNERFFMSHSVVEAKLATSRFVSISTIEVRCALSTTSPVDRDDAVRNQRDE